MSMLTNVCVCVCVCACMRACVRACVRASHLKISPVAHRGHGTQQFHACQCDAIEAQHVVYDFTRNIFIIEHIADMCAWPYYHTCRCPGGVYAFFVRFRRFAVPRPRPCVSYLLRSGDHRTGSGRCGINIALAYEHCSCFTSIQTPMLFHQHTNTAVVLLAYKHCSCFTSIQTLQLFTSIQTLQLFY